MLHRERVWKTDKTCRTQTEGSTFRVCGKRNAIALGVSRGAGLQQPLATAIIFGLIAAVPLVLLFLPALMLGLARFDTQQHQTNVQPA